jgi:hypothetical protein
LRLSSTEVSRTYIVRAPTDNEKTAATIRSVLKIAQDAGDEPPAGLLTDPAAGAREAALDDEEHAEIT